MEDEILTEDDETCFECNGTGKVEGVNYIYDDSTGYNTLAEPTGEFKNCPVCHIDDEDLGE